MLRDDRRLRSGGRARPAAPEEQLVTIDGIRTRTIELRGDGPPILLLHGFSDSADTWRPLMDRLAVAGRACVAVDLPHFGRSERPADRPLIARWDRFVAAFIREHGAASGSMVAGNSLGGLLALRAAQDKSAAIRGVAGIGPAGLGLQPWVGVVERLGIGLSALSRAPLPDRVVKQAAAQACGRLAVGRPVDPELIDRYASHIHASDIPHLIGLARRVLVEVSAADAVDPSRISAPVQLIWGSRDRLCPPAGAQRVVDALPGTRVEVLEGTGHCVQLEEPAVVARRARRGRRGLGRPSEQRPNLHRGRAHLRRGSDP